MQFARCSLLALVSLALSTLASGSTGTAAQPLAKVSVGATLPLTGSEARIGGFFKEGYELAFEEASTSTPRKSRTCSKALPRSGRRL